MSERNDGGPAFPAWELNGQNRPEMTCFGMSLRDFFAAKAMQGLLASDPRFDTNDRWNLADAAYAMADAMLFAREES